MMRVVYIRWHDACYSTDESNIAELGGLADLHEIGFLLQETDKAVVLGLEHQEGATTARLTLTIPKCNIVERRDVQFSRLFTKPRKKKETT